MGKNRKVAKGSGARAAERLGKTLKERAEQIGSALKRGFEERQRFEQVDDDEGLDEVRIKVVPRFKTSGLSGDGWRVSAHVELLRKGVVLDKTRYSSLRGAVRGLDSLELQLCELDLENGNFTEAGKKRVTEGLGALLPTECAQPGCAEKPTTTYKTKMHFTRCCQTAEPRNEDGWPPDEYRAFCPRHTDRGDCHLSDANKNYELFAGPGLVGAVPDPDDESPSSTVVVDLSGGK